MNFTTETDTVGGEDQAAANFFVRHQSFMMSHAACPLSNVMQIKEEFIEQCSGCMLSDTCCANCGQYWYDGMKHKLKRFEPKPSKYTEREDFCFGAGKPAYNILGALTQLAAKGKCYTVRVSIVPVLVPAIISRAHDIRAKRMHISELGIRASLARSIRDCTPPLRT